MILHTEFISGLKCGYMIDFRGNFASVQLTDLCALYWLDSNLRASQVPLVPVNTSTF